MSLSKLFNRTNNIIKNPKSIRRMPLSSMTGRSQCLSTVFRKRHLCASFSVEASVVMPVFICVVVCIMIFFRILAIQWGISVGAINHARKAAVYTEKDMFESLEGTKGGKLGVVGTAYGSIAAQNIPTKFIKFGFPGISLLESELGENDIDIIAEYKVPVPVGLFGKHEFNIIQRTRARRWVGYDPQEGMEDGDYVYVTKSGVAYHNDINCVYLNPSIKTIGSEGIDSKRNKEGGKYYPCDRCKPKGRSNYYITDYGTVYHSSVSCSSLKRNIERIHLDEAAGYHVCGKCG